VAFETELSEVRRVAQKAGCFSWTSADYQSDILNFVTEHRHRGAGVVEVGTYKGGLTAQLAVLCQAFGWPLFTMDISQPFLDTARTLLESLQLADCVRFHCGNLASFAGQFALQHRPVLAILDGDHRYQAVIDDIAAIYRLNQLPVAAAFHDYSLRHPTTGEDVERAVTESFGDRMVCPIGAQIRGDAAYPTREHPSDDGHYWQVPGSEGAIVELPNTIERRRPFTFKMFRRAKS
jgi:Methyltransferase domain